MSEQKKVLKRVADLPKWFDLSKYESSISLNLAGWQSELQRRWYAQLLIDHTGAISPIGNDLTPFLDPTPKPGQPVVMRSVIGDARSPFLDPTLKPRQPVDLRPICARIFSEPIKLSIGRLMPKKSDDNRHVGFLEIGHAFNLVDYVRQSTKGKPFVEAWHNLDQGSLKNGGRQQALDLMKTSIDDVVTDLKSPTSTWNSILAGSYDWVSATIDITAPDEVLFGDFKAWLSKAREKTRISTPKRKFTKKDFQRWSDYQVLAYLDLSIWAFVDGMTITNNLMGEVLFPLEEEIDTTEKIRQTVSPLAKRLVSTEIIYSLAAQEHAEKLENPR